jgi:ElaB/YqjD/DUF883 family membrane-anchored ribosome-binding protein
MGQSADQIRREIDQSRDDAAAKIDQLQSQVQGTAQEVRDSVQGTTEKVVEDLKGTVDETVESVRQSLDLRHQIEQRPLLSLGVALVGGFLVGGMTGGSGGHHEGHHQPYQQPEAGRSASYTGASRQQGAVSQGIRTAVQKTGLEDTISDAAAALIGSVTDQLTTTLNRNFPGFADKMKTAQSSDGSFTAKAKEAQGQTTSV